MRQRYFSIRSKIIELAYLQCVKMLQPPDPEYPNIGDEYKRIIDKQEPDGTLINRTLDNGDPNPAYPVPEGAAPVDWEQCVIETLSQSYGNIEDCDGNPMPINTYMKYVTVGTIEPQKIEQEDKYPALFIENASEGYKPKSLGEKQGVEHSSEVEIIPITIRVLTKDYRIYKSNINGSNPIQLAEIREVLDFLLDPRYFRGLLHDDRYGYDLVDSIVLDAGITYSRNNEGLRHPVEMNDFRLDVKVQQQKEVDVNIGDTDYGETANRD